MARCSVLLTEDQKVLLTLELMNGEFSDKLYDYYQGLGEVPDISLLVRSINDHIVPDYFKGYKVQDLNDFLETGRNVNALTSAISDVMFKIESARTKNVDDPDYFTNPGKIIELLKVDAANKLASVVQDAKEVKATEGLIDSSSEGLKPAEEVFTDFFNQRLYKDVQAYREDRFKGSAATETMLLSKFIHEGFIKNVFINTDLGKGKGLVNQRQERGKVSEIDRNLKAYRKSLLESLVTRFDLHDTVNGEPRRMVVDDQMLIESNFQNVLGKLEGNVLNVSYKGENVSLDKEGLLTEIVNEWRKSGNEDLKKIVDNYVDYLILSDFDKLFDYYAQGSIHVNTYNDSFDPSTLKYSVTNATSVEAINAGWVDKIQDGIDFSSDLYKLLVSVTPIKSYITGQDTKEYLYPALVSEVMSKYYDNLDFEDGQNSIKQNIIDGLNDPNNSIVNKNTLYTLYKNFFEEEGDKVTLHPKNTNNEVKSYANALFGVEDKSLLQLVSMPIEQTPKVFHAEASDEKGNGVSIVLANTRTSTQVDNIIREDIARSINVDQDRLNSLLSKYNLKFTPTAITYTIADDPNRQYELSENGSKVYDLATIKDLSKDLLGIDFDNNPANKELWELLQARAIDGHIANNFLVFLNDALRVVEARQELLNPDVAKAIDENKVDANTNNEILNNLIKSGKINYRDINSTVIPLNNPNANVVYDMMYEAENKYTGNQVRKTLRTLEGTTVAGFTTPTYFFTLKNNHNKIRQTLNSLVGYDRAKQVLGNNLFINDSKLLERFHVRGATQVGGIVKSNANMNELETLSYNLNLGYFGLINKAIQERTPIKVMFDVTTYSDKTTNLLPYINNTYTSPTSGTVKLFVDNGVAVPEKVTRDLHFQTNGHYYRAYASNIVDTWRSVYAAVSPEALKAFDDLVLSERTPSGRLKALNAINGGKDGLSGFFHDSNNKFKHGLVGLQAARFYADKAGVALNNLVHYQNTAKSINNTQTPLTVKPLLINYVKLFDDMNSQDAYLAHMSKHMISMVNRMREIGYSLSGPAAEAIAQLYPNMAQSFKTANGYSLTRYNDKNVTNVSDINPALRKYFWDFNLISENLMNSSLGPIYAHKGKNEFGMWVTQVKRNVAATASIRKYVLGLPNGVENYTRVAFVDDFVTNLKTILSNKEAVVDLDGASLETLTQRLKTMNSLNHRFNGTGGMDHKSFFSHFDPNTGEFGETKHAAFAMDNEMIRQSKGSDIDLYDLHRKLYATDISKVDITKSWNGHDLSSFVDHYYWDRNYNFDENHAGHVFRLDSIVFKGRDVHGDALYDITKTNMTLDPSSPYTLQNQKIKTMFDLWETLGSIDSVEPTDDKTSVSFQNGNEQIYLKPAITAAERLLDYECFIGTKGEKILPADRIRLNRRQDAQAWSAYNSLFRTEGIVNSHIDLLRKAYNLDASNMEHVKELENDLYSHDAKVGAFEFINKAKENENLLEKFFGNLLEESRDAYGSLQFNSPARDYQRFKGQNIDRISFAGAQKVGQFQLNDSSTISKKKLAQFNYKVTGELRNDFEVGDKVLWNNEPATITRIYSNDEVTPTQQLESPDGEHATRSDSIGNKRYDFTTDKGENYVAISGSELTLSRPANLPRIPGITELLTHKISNYNGGIQLNAWHEADEATVTAPTQMLNALIFRAFSLHDASEIYDAIGNIVDQGLQYVLRDEFTGLPRTYNIPRLVADLSNAEFYAQNKETLLRVFKDLLNEQAKSGDDFTLEDLIVKSFDHLNVPVDDPQIFNTAVAELTNYFSKSGIRTNFDGIFSVLTPSSGMMQVHSVRGGYLPVKTEHGLEYRKLPANTTTVLNRFDFEQWKRLNLGISTNDALRAKFVEHDEGGNELPLHPSEIIDHQPRDLKGQQVMITYADGRQQELSVLRADQKHLIPEAEALSTLTALINKYKGFISDSNHPYDSSTNDVKLGMLRSLIDDFKKEFKDLLKKDKAFAHTFNSFRGKYLSANPRINPNISDEELLSIVNDSMSKTKRYREDKEKQFETANQTTKLVMSREYGYQEELNSVGKAFLGELQDFLHNASFEGHIPLSLQNPELFTPAGDLNGAKISISRAEVLAPLTAKTKFKLRDGDTINEIDENFFRKRLAEDLDYLNVKADYVILSNYGKRLYVHDTVLPKRTAKSNQVIEDVNGRQWYTNEAGNRLFEVPRGVQVANIGGAIHLYTGGKINMTGSNEIMNSVNRAFRSDEGEEFVTYGLPKTPEQLADRRAEAQLQIEQKAKEMWSSWQKYLTVIGTRIPGQHFQSFQGMKIVGFTEGNKIYVPNEVTLLSGSDFDIDKQNIIYYSIKDDGTIATWHPASKLDSLENLEKSLKLPMQSKRSRDYFTVARDPEGRPLDKVYSGHTDDTDWTNLDALLDVYGALRAGFKIDDTTHPRLLDALAAYEQAPNKGGIKAVKNFAVEKNNNIIDHTANYTLLSKQVTMDTPAMFADNSEKAATAALGRREIPTAIVDQKQSNMVGKKVIGIMAAGGLKTYSAMSFSYNNDLKSTERLVDHLNKLEARLTQLKAEAVPNTELINSYGSEISKMKDAIANVFDRLKVRQTVNELNYALNKSDLNLIANVNYKNLSADLIYKLYAHIGYSPNVSNTESATPMEIAYSAGPHVFKSFMEVYNAFEDDAAEIISQLLSAATDNAKELILNKINANPDLAGIYSSLLMYGVPFEEIVDLTNSPVMDTLISKGSTNIFTPSTKDNTIKDVVGSILQVSAAEKRLEDANAPKDKENLSKRLAGLRKGLLSRYNMSVLGNTVTDLNTDKEFKLDDVLTISKALDVSEELRVLSRGLSINQGVKSNTWDLYSFRKTIENQVSRMLVKVEGEVTDFTRFSLKHFLDSFANGTDDYHTQVMDAIRNFGPSAVNILHILTSNPHFAKQLTAYNAANTILNLASFKTRVMDVMEEKLKELGVVSPNAKLNKVQFHEIERFIENTVIENFIYSETTNNSDPNTKPIFYDGDKELRIDNRESQAEFADWVRDKFLPAIKDIPSLKGNEFIGELGVRKKYDKLLNAPYEYIALRMDTTNVKSIQQKEYRDAYIYNLKQIYDRNVKDNNSEDPAKQNNIFNVLFWYNLVLNKNNITKNSYAKLLGEVMRLDDTKDNPYRRYLELEGNIGKSDDESYSPSITQVVSNGVTFDLIDLLANYDFGEVKRIGSKQSAQYDTDFDDDGGYDEDVNDYIGDDEDFDNGDNDEYYEEEEEYNPELEEGEALPRGNIKPAVITKTKSYDTPGTKVQIKLLGRDELTFTRDIQSPYSLIPHGGENRNKRTFITNYKPWSGNLKEVTDVDSINLQKMMNSTIHSLLTNLSSEISVNIIQRDSEGKEIISTFDPTKDYNCL